MKLLRILPLMILLACSCQSEYQKQLGKAKVLVVAAQKINSSFSAGGTASSREALLAIKKEISFQAHMSGNEAFFHQELDSFRKRLETEKMAASPMLSNYP